MTREGICRSVVEAISNTPLVELARITREIDGRILAKLEYLLPGGSKKDRIARQIVEEATAKGDLKPGQTVVELTSGNTGTGLAIVCRALDHPFVAVMSQGNTRERRIMMQALGAEVVLVDQSPGGQYGCVSGADLELVEIATRRIVEKRQAFRADQFATLANRRAHYLRTGPEILKQSDGHFDAFCDFVGSAGSFAGCSRAFKEFNPQIECYVVEPAESAVLKGEVVRNPSHAIQGGGYQRTELPLLNREDVSGYLTVTDRDAMTATRSLAREEGIFAGYSAGANLDAALQLLRGPCRGKTIVILIPDSGMKYLSGNLWQPKANDRE